MARARLRNRGQNRNNKAGARGAKGSQHKCRREWSAVESGEVLATMYSTGCICCRAGREAWSWSSLDAILCTGLSDGRPWPYACPDSEGGEAAAMLSMMMMMPLLQHPSHTMRGALVSAGTLRQARW